MSVIEKRLALAQVDFYNCWVVRGRTIYVYLSELLLWNLDYIVSCGHGFALTYQNCNFTFYFLYCVSSLLEDKFSLVVYGTQTHYIIPCSTRAHMITNSVVYNMYCGQVHSVVTDDKHAAPKHCVTCASAAYAHHDFFSFLTAQINFYYFSYRSTLSLLRLRQ